MHEVYMVAWCDSGQAALPATVPVGQRVSVVLTPERGRGKGKAVVICTLTSGRLDSVSLDLFLDKYAEFSLQGASQEVHLTVP
ncbi:FK506-binding protein [Haematococcus lacustris]|uniref:FK506-binding protein n=1 Tax=Haematococcus lacustris TaxID=44745 RepID=A0A699YRD4_HAELA|nr:FK506-binding protein [Haematococcus lacustris]